MNDVKKDTAGSKKSATEQSCKNLRLIKVTDLFDDRTGTTKQEDETNTDEMDKQEANSYKHAARQCHAETEIIEDSDDDEIIPSSQSTEYEADAFPKKMCDDIDLTYVSKFDNVAAERRLKIIKKQYNAFNIPFDVYDSTLENL